LKKQEADSLKCRHNIDPLELNELAALEARIAMVKESFVRFDRIQVIHKSWLEHRPIKLTSEALECLQTWLYCYLVWDPSTAAAVSKMCDLVLEYREEKLKVLGLV
jgi:hypothetical protein